MCRLTLETASRKYCKAFLQRFTLSGRFSCLTVHVEFRANLVYGVVKFEFVHTHLSLAWTAVSNFSKSACLRVRIRGGLIHLTQATALEETVSITNLSDHRHPWKVCEHSSLHSFLQIVVTATVTREICRIALPYSQ